MAELSFFVAKPPSVKNEISDLAYNLFTYLLLL